MTTDLLLTAGIEGPLWYLLVAQATLFTLMSLLLVYPLVAYARNVAHTEAFFMLALAFFSVTVVAILDFILGMTTAAHAVRFAGGTFALVGVYLFARDFIHINGSGVGFDTEFGFDFGDSFQGVEDEREE